MITTMTACVDVNNLTTKGYHGHDALELTTHVMYLLDIVSLLITPNLGNDVLYTK